MWCCGSPGIWLSHLIVVKACNTADVWLWRFPRILKADLAVYHDGNNLTAVEVHCREIAGRTREEENSSGRMTVSLWTVQNLAAGQNVFLNCLVDRPYSFVHQKLCTQRRTIMSPRKSSYLLFFFFTLSSGPILILSSLYWVVYIQIPIYALVVELERWK